MLPLASNDPSHQRGLRASRQRCMDLDQDPHYFAGVCIVAQGISFLRLPCRSTCRPGLATRWWVQGLRFEVCGLKDRSDFGVVRVCHSGVVRRSVLAVVPVCTHAWKQVLGVRAWLGIKAWYAGMLGERACRMQSVNPCAKSETVVMQSVCVV